MIARRQFLKVSIGTVNSEFGMRVLPCALLRSLEQRWNAGIAALIQES